MSPSTFFAGVFVLALGTCPVLSQDSCITKCTNEMIEIAKNVKSQAEACALIPTYTNCLSAPGCDMPKAQLEGMLNQALAPLKSLGYDCGGDGAGSGSQMGTGMDFGGGLGQECATGIATCTQQYAAIMESGSVTTPDAMCGEVQKFMDCSFSKCPKSDAMKQFVDKTMNPLKEQGINCDIKIDGIESGSGSASGSGSGSGSGSSMGGGMPIDQACSKKIDTCMDKFTAGMSGETKMEDGACGLVQDVADCVYKLECIKSESQKKATVTMMANSWKQNGVNCEIKAGDETVTGSGSATGTKYDIGSPSAGKIIEVFGNLQTVLSKYDCQHLPMNCSIRFGGNDSEPDCSALKKMGSCMISECEGVQGTGDDKKAADMIVKFAEETLKCKFTAEEIVGNGGLGVWASLTVLLLAVLVNKILV